MKNCKLPFAVVFTFLSVFAYAQVGIGTDSPDEILDIESSDATQTAIDLNNTSTGDPMIHFQIGGTDMFSMGVDNSDGDKFKIGTTDLTTNFSIVIDANGDVGIGDSDPGYKLEVNGDVNLTTIDDVYRIGGVHVLSKPNTENIYVGEGAGSSADGTENDNTFVGYNAGNANTSGDYNTFLGSGAGVANTTGSQNTFIGFESGSSNISGLGNVFIGYQAGAAETGSNKLYIDNSNTTTPLIYGDFSTDELTVNGSLVVNEQGADEDFRVESDNNTHMLFVDASTDQVLVGSENSFSIGGALRDFQVAGTDSDAGIGLVRHSDDASGSTLTFVKSRGSEGAPTVVSDGDVIGSIDFYGYDGSGYSSQGAAIEAVVDGTPGSNDLPGRLNFKTTADGAASATTNMTILQSGFVGIGQVTPTTRLFVEEDGATVATFNRTTDDGTIVDFQRDGVSQGTISVAAGVVSYNAFTGSHFGYSKKHFERGYLISLTGKNERYHDNPNSEILYGIKYTTKENDPNVLGAYNALLEPKMKHSVDNPHQIMAVGNGVMWVTNKGGDISIGDYLISSDVEGCAMKDLGTYEVSNVIARAAEPVDWSVVEEDEHGVKKNLISVFYECFKKPNYQVQLDELEKEVLQLKATLLND